MLLSPPIFTSARLPSTSTAAPSAKRRCINPVISASRALHAITSTTDTLPSTIPFGAPLQMPLSPPMEGIATLPRRRVLRRKQTEDGERGGKRRRTTTKTKTEDKFEDGKTGESKAKMLFVTPEQRGLPTEVPRGLTRTTFAQAFEPTRPRGLSDQDDQDLINLVANSLVSTATAHQQQRSEPQPDNYTITSTTKACPSTPPSSSRKRRRED